jgi:hypothetical protein
MANSEAGLIGGFSAGQRVIAANTEVGEGSFGQILRDTAGAISRPVLWAMEFLAVAGLIFCLCLMSAVSAGPEALALGLAAIYFSLSASLGAYLLRVDLAC